MVTTITASQPTANATPNGTDVMALSGPGILEDFEDTDFSGYTNNTYLSQQTNYVQTGSAGGRVSSVDGEHNRILRHDGSTSTGNNYTLWVREDSSAGGSYPMMGIAIATVSSNEDFHAFCISPSNSAVDWRMSQAGTMEFPSHTSPSSLSTSADTWYKIDIEWASDNSKMVGRVYDVNGNLLGKSTLSESLPDDTSGGMGFYSYDGAFDMDTYDGGQTTTYLETATQSTATAMPNQADVTQNEVVQAVQTGVSATTLTGDTLELLDAEQAHAVANTTVPETFSDSTSWDITDSEGVTHTAKFAHNPGTIPEWKRGQAMTLTFTFDAHGITISDAEAEASFQKFRDEYARYLTESTVEVWRDWRGTPLFRQTPNQHAPHTSHVFKLGSHQLEEFWVVVTNIAESRRAGSGAQTLTMTVVPLTPASSATRAEVIQTHEVD